MEKRASFAPGNGQDNVFSNPPEGHPVVIRLDAEQTMQAGLRQIARRYRKSLARRKCAR
jgi:hypothetical protein